MSLKQIPALVDKMIFPASFGGFDGHISLYSVEKSPLELRETGVLPQHLSFLPVKLLFDHLSRHQDCLMLG